MAHGILKTSVGHAITEDGKVVRNDNAGPGALMIGHDDAAHD